MGCMPFAAAIKFPENRLFALMEVIALNPEEAVTVHPVKIIDPDAELLVIAVDEIAVKTEPTPLTTPAPSLLTQGAATPLIVELLKTKLPPPKFLTGVVPLATPNIVQELNVEVPVAVA
jgi:hypothetical protein